MATSEQTDAYARAGGGGKVERSAAEIRKRREQRILEQQDEERRAIAQRNAQEAAAAQGGGVEGVAEQIRARGARNVTEGMKLMGEADRSRSVQVANRNYGAIKGYTDTMGAGAKVGRRGLFNPQAAPQPAAAPAQPAAPVQVVVQAPGAAPPAPPQPAPQAPVVPEAAPQPAPAASGTPVPAAAIGRAPGELPAPAADLPPVPLEGEPPPDETPEQELARLEAEAASMTPEQLEAQAAADYTGDAATDPMEGFDPYTLPGGTPDPFADPVLQRQLDAEERAAGQRVAVAQAEADGLAHASEQARMALAEEQAAREEQDRVLRERLEASEVANKTVADLTAKAREMGAVDPKRAYSNMGIGRRIGFALQIALSSFGGRARADVFAPLQRYVDDDVEDQVQQRAKAAGDVDAARKVADDQASLLDQARAVVGDPDTAKAMVKQARWEQIKAQLQAEIGAAQPGMVSAEQEALLTKIEGEIAKNKAIVDQQAANNPQFFTKSVKVYSKGQREAMRLAGKEMIQSGVGAGERADEQAGKIELTGIEQQYKALEQQQAAAAKHGNKAAEQAYQFGKDTAVAQQVVGLVDKVLGQDDIAGYGWTAGPTIGTEAKNTESDLGAIAEAFGRLQSQGVISPDEEVRFREMISSGTGWGGEEQLRRNLQRIRTFVNLRIEAHKRGISPEARTYYDRNVAGSDFAPIWNDTDAGASSSVVQEDE